MQQFNVVQGSFQEVKAKAIRNKIIIIITAVCVLLAFVILQNGHDQNGIVIFLIMIPVYIIIQIVTFSRSLIKLKDTFESICIKFTDEQVIGEQWSKPDVIFYKHDISNISKTRTGSLIIKNKNSDEIIIVPKQMENYVELESILNKISPIKILDSNNFIFKAKQIIFLIGGLAFIPFFLSTNKLIICISGILVISLFVYLYYLIKKRVAKTPVFYIILALLFLAVLISKMQQM